MGTYSHSTPPRPHWHRPLLFGLAAMLMSCSPAKADCSDPGVIGTVKDLVVQMLGENYNLSAMYDLKSSKLELRAIRTTYSDDRRSDCRTDLLLELELNSELKAAMAKPSSNPTEAQMMKQMFGNTSRSVDLRYSVERTDDGKELYVSIQPF